LAQQSLENASMIRQLLKIIMVSAALCPCAANAQSEAPSRTRVALGPQLKPSFPGSDSVSLRPLIDVARTRGDDPYTFEAPDESFGFPVLSIGRVEFGPALGIEGSRTADDVGAELPKVGFTFEVGGFAEYRLSDAFRLRAEARKGLGGHKGWVGTIGADYVAREGNDWLFSLGPRVTIADDRYNSAYFGVAPADADRAGLPAYDAEGGVEAIGLTAGWVRQLTARWGIYSYAKYDRLTGDAADSPIVRRLGSRDQFSGGLALTYTFGAGVD
jgi:outer membrane scaffolding protein for murein synthesis (MipA/OmpV family)